MRQTMPRTAADRRAALWIAVLAAALLALFLASFVLGRYDVPIGQVVRILLSRVIPLTQTWTGSMEIAVLNVRLPRILLACLVGCSLSAAGTAYQSVFRNPMAAPDILGASSGACFGAALAILLGASYAVITASSFLFGLAAVGLTYLVGRLSRIRSTLAMVLAGMMVGSLFSAGTSFIKLVADTTDQPNMEGNSKSTFTFSSTLKNQTADQQLYALMANAPRGWNVIFKPNYKQATSAQVEPNSSQNVSIDITPPANVEAGSYKIPVRAATGTTSAELELEVVVTGSFQMELTTPRGLLSTDITAGDVKRIELEVKNTGSSLLKDIQLSASKPADWEVTFEPTKIDALKAGETSTVMATLKASKKALPGDYVTTIMAKTPEVNADAQFRIAVKTPMIWGWVGVLIIIATIGVVYYLFRKYGRR